MVNQGSKAAHGSEHSTINLCAVGGGEGPAGSPDSPSLFLPPPPQLLNKKFQQSQMTLPVMWTLGGLICTPL